MNRFRKIVDFHKNNPVISCKKLVFKGIEKGYDVYNPSVSFDFEGKKYIFGRVERRDKWASSRVFLFENVKENEKFSFWKKSDRLQEINLEDPFIKMFKDEYVFGGVLVKKQIFSKRVDFRTVFYRGKSPFNLKKFAQGPENMKDIRLIELSNGKVGVFTRPLGGKYGRGKIGYVEINSLDSLNEISLNEAQIISLPFSEGEWGGVNDVVKLKNGYLGVLGHLAHASLNDERNKFYYPISFRFNPKSKKISKIEVLLDRADLPFDLPKNRFLYNVIFPGGILIGNNGFSKIYAGVSDSQSYEIILKNPF